MQLNSLDLAFIVAFFAIALATGLYAARTAGKDSASFFLSGRGMPWWLLGTSMVATTFAADTPNLVTQIVRQNGVSGNWVWWAFLLTGMLTVFVFAKLWRRSGVTTDIEFYELRYSGRSAAILRGFRAVYLGVLFNVLVMASVSLAAIKIGGILLGLPPWQCIVYASLVTVTFSTLGGLKGVLLTDFILFFLAMLGSIATAVFALGHPEIGGLSGLWSHPQIAERMAFVPALQTDSAGDWTTESWNLLVMTMVLPLTVQWWSVWYPGSEPGGGGYIAQRMLAAGNERDATAAVLLFNVVHYAVRPWPWILVGLCSLVVFPTAESIGTAFPNVDASMVGDDLGYPAMLQTVLPHGWLGLVLASLIAAYMSTISTHLNWGSSYIVNDFYGRFIQPDASDKRLVLVGRLSTVALMIAAGVLALQLSDAIQAFQILLQIGAGTGLLFILRWFWWRINAAAEITAMIVSFLASVILTTGDFGLAAWQTMLLSIGITTLAWMAAAILGPATDAATLEAFVMQTNPGGPGWRRIYSNLNQRGEVPTGQPTDFGRSITRMILACISVYAVLFGTGWLLYGDYLYAVIAGLIAILAAVIGWRR